MLTLTLRDLIGDVEVGEFEPKAIYIAAFDAVEILLEDVGYVVHQIAPGFDVAILMHPSEDRIVGIRIYDVSARPNGAELLKRCGMN